mmetsp:Transcript_22520/g.27831  ORF Transcript_22520/g.27831 Transcript_22520/m.27831 type:complete len:155 (-) Transcript_22520:539-1003(-)
MRKLRIHQDDLIVCYDAADMAAAARAAFSFRHFGAANVRIIDGGLRKWLSEKRANHSGPYKVGDGLTEEGSYAYSVADEQRVISDIDKMHHIAYYLANKASEWQVVDARPSRVFLAEGPSGDRPGFRLGHITGSTNLPFQELIDPETNCLRKNK